MKGLLGGAAIAALICTSVAAPATGALPARTVAVVASAVTLNAGTPLTLAVAEEVNSSTHRAGDNFRLTVLNDLKVGDTVVIPRGTPAYAEVTWRTGKAAFGKSGKMEFSLRYIDLNGTKIPVTGDFRQEGEGNTVATGVGVLAIGVFAGFITGKRARLPQGRELMAQIAQTVPFQADGHIDAGFDSNAAMFAAEANTPRGQCAKRAAALPSKKQGSALKKCFGERMD